MIKPNLNRPHYIAPDSALIESSDIWQHIRQNRSKFYTKSLKSYVGYFRGQAAKYGIRGSKLENLISEIETLASNLSYPEKVDTKEWENFIVTCINRS